jgi:hypothetical protein
VVMSIESPALRLSMVAVGSAVAFAPLAPLGCCHRCGSSGSAVRNAAFCFSAKAVAAVGWAEFQTRGSQPQVRED